MSEELKTNIYNEVKSHEAGIRDIHVEIITEEIYRQLKEIFNEEQLNVISNSLQGEFKSIIDALIPLVEEYEERIDAEINIQISRLLGQLKK